MDPRNDPLMLDKMIMFEDVIGMFTKDEIDEIRTKMEQVNGRLKT